MGSIKEIMKEDNINISNNNVAQLPLVSICSITYNHEPYIRQCLDGFLMQKTNFKYEIIIHDDASTDGTAEIIKEYTFKTARFNFCLSNNSCVSFLFCSVISQ